MNDTYGNVRDLVKELVNLRAARRIAAHDYVAPLEQMREQIDQAISQNSFEDPIDGGRIISTKAIHQGVTRGFELQALGGRYAVALTVSEESGAKLITTVTAPRDVETFERVLFAGSPAQMVVGTSGPALDINSLTLLERFIHAVTQHEQYLA